MYLLDLFEEEGKVGKRKEKVDGEGANPGRKGDSLVKRFSGRKKSSEAFNKWRDSLAGKYFSFFF